MDDRGTLELRVGLLVVGGLAATVALLLFAGSLSFQRSYRLTVYMPGAGGLQVGSAVKLTGVPIGKVSAISTSTDPRGAIRAEIEVERVYRIYESSELVLSTSGIFGDSYLLFSAPGRVTGRVVPMDGSGVVVAKAPMLDEVAEQAKRVVGFVSRILDERTEAEVRRILKGAGETADQAPKLVAEIRSTVGGLQASIGKIDHLVEGLETSRGELTGKAGLTLTEATATIRQVRTQIRAVTARADDLLTALVPMANRVQGVISAVRPVVGSLAERTPKLLEQITGLAGALRELAEGLRAGRGLLGQALTSDRLAKDLNDAAIDLVDAARRISTTPEILVWGEGETEQAAAAAARERRKQQRAFTEGWNLLPAASGPHTP